MNTMSFVTRTSSKAMEAAHTLEINWCTMLFACLVYLSTTACGANRATGPWFEEQVTTNVQETIFYFYRPALPAAPDKYSSRIYLSGQLIGELDHGGFFWYRGAPGRYRVSLSEKGNSDDLWFITSGGASYFVKWDNVNALPWKGGTQYGPLLRRVDEAQALQELRSCRQMKY